MHAEHWLPIDGFVGHYEVSDLGRVRSLDRYVDHARSGRQRMHGRVLSLSLDTKGYQRITLRHGERVEWCAVHRLVLRTFAHRDDWREMHVNHINGVRVDNRLCNLEWCTNAENRLHSYRVLKRPNPMKGKVGALHHNARAVVGRCIATGAEKRYAAMSEAAKEGFTSCDISACCRGTQKTHRGFVWRFAEGVVR